MDRNIVKILKELRHIEPDKDYARRSKIIILSSKEQRETKFDLAIARFNFKNAVALARFSGIFIVAFFLIFSMLGGVSYVNKTFSPLALEGLDQKSLIAEAENINNSIQITLEEIKYLDQTNKKTINTIDELSKNVPNVPEYSNISISATSSSTDSSTSTEDIENFLITSPTSTDETEDAINALLDKIAE